MVHQPHLLLLVQPFKSHYQLISPAYTPQPSPRTQPPQQEDQLSEASGLASPNQPPSTTIPTTTNPNTPEAVLALASASLLPTIPARPHDRIVTGDFI